MRRQTQLHTRHCLRLGLDLLAPNARVADAGVFDHLHQAVFNNVGPSTTRAKVIVVT